MTVHQKIASTLVALGMVIIVLYLVRKRHLREEFTLIWLGCAFAMIGAVWLYPLLVFITDLIGAVSPTTTLFLFGFIFVLLICLHLSTTLSKLKTQMKDLAQKVALMEANQQEEKDSKVMDPE